MVVVLAVMALIALVFGVVFIVRARDSADVLRDTNLVAKDLYTPATVGCAGVALFVFGLALGVAAVVAGVTGSAAP